MWEHICSLYTRVLNACFEQVLFAYVRVSACVQPCCVLYSPDTDFLSYTCFYWSVGACVCVCFLHVVCRSISVCSSVLNGWGTLWATLKHLASRPCPCQHGAVCYPSPSRQRHFLPKGSSVAFATLQIHSINPNYTPPKSPPPSCSTNKWSESVKHLLCGSSQWLWR